MLWQNHCHTFVQQRLVSAELTQAGYGPAWMHVIIRADSTLQGVFIQWWRHFVDALLMGLLQVTCLYIWIWIAGNVQCTMSPKENQIVNMGMGYSLDTS
jgi:hypothetical protein